MDFWSSYKDEETMRKNWEIITEYCIGKKGNLVKFWSGADPQKQGFTSDGVVVGQTWDGPIVSMMKAGEPVAYQTTDEGALAWVCLLYTSPSPRDRSLSRMPSSA